LTKIDFIKLIAQKSELTRKDAAKFLVAFKEAIVETMSKGSDVALVGFGTFCVVDRAARKAMNFKTKAVINIPASKGIKFKPGKSLKDAVD
jgi:DNA-binding protein HU-beta